MRKRSKIFINVALIVLILIITVIFIYPWAMVWIGISVLVNPASPSSPEIKYGEFPIKITYEVCGEEKELEDIIICKFDGFESLGEAGKRRKWKAELKSGNEKLILLKQGDEINGFEISKWYGFPEYYMGDFIRESRSSYENSLMCVTYLGMVEWKNGVPQGSTPSLEEVWEKYKLKIIDIQYSKPIENSFK